MSLGRFLTAASSCLILVVLVWVVVPEPVHALFKKPLPLKTIISGADAIFVGEVTRVDESKKRLMISWKSDLKGRTAFAQLGVGVPASRKPAQDQPKFERLFERVEVGLPVVVFSMTNRGKTLFLVYTEGTWFSFRADAAERPKEAEKPATRAACAFGVFEIYLRRSFAGKTKEFLELLPAVLAGKKKAPRYDPKVKPGIGPKLPPRKGKPTSFDRG